ncbi:uncharacterized protein BXZ73DRAFT_89881 [Epithele typhae]|uniref:uncharacterized protein n=1 Tax=Epithele typhae TaxID=378194 RepID=UPI00200892CA|nr:uncharacterized protein BXZ73DRAFT_89881 [Epithele typhae]KAH9932709.1 hypothetical protein BXZ73DRAFT_89881 [Epithele typhae]
MALTATAQSALHREPAWDEAIVPALRKRLKDESSALAKRISAASMGSNEDLSQDHHHYYLPPISPPTSSSSSYALPNSKPSAIPRPSLSSSTTSPYQRSRALSQPYADFSVDSSSDRPTSPAVNGNASKSTRIPVSRTRAGSTSSQGHSVYNGSNGRANGRLPDQSDAYLYPVEERERAQQAHSQTSRSTIRLPRHKGSDIFQEPPPFSSSPPRSQDYNHGRMSPERERMSSDSEEHPFEHWYRGDVARNGGVGELRVARRQEMLDIANYGHTLQSKSSLRATPSGLSSRGELNGRVRGRSRADSVGARGSVYIDPDEVHLSAAVMEERPLTDLEDDGYEDHLDDYYTQAVQPHLNGSISSPSLERSDTPTSRMTQNTSRSRIPQPSRSRTTTPTPSKPVRSASDDAAPPPGTWPEAPRPATQVKTQGLPPSMPSPASALSGSSPPTPSTPSGKRIVKSPTGTAAPASKKAKSRAPPSSMKRPAGPPRNEENRRSIGQYPSLDGDEDAIPSWTQPKPANGNWDDVVLPVVARKRGLQDQYEHADGSPKPKEPEEVIYEPAPGTFGYDATKYRKRNSGGIDAIPMDEFGQRPPPSPHSPKSPEFPQPPASPVAQPPPMEHGSGSPLQSSSRDRRADSPPPFAHYMKDGASTPAPPQMQMEILPPLGPLPPANHKEQIPEEDVGGGCCKCVIM